MFREFFNSPRPARRLFAYGGALLILGSALASALVSALVNSWYGAFYDLAQGAAQTAILASNNVSSSMEEAMASHDAGVAKMWELLWRFFVIVMPFAVLQPFASFVGSHYAFAWRLSLVESYLERWEAARGESIEGASQRIHEDTQRFASGLRVGLVTWLEAMLTLAVFAPRLVELGAQLSPPPIVRALLPPTDAWLVVVAAAVALTGFGMAMLVTAHLVLLEVANQKVEADLRKRLVLAEGPMPPPPPPPQAKEEEEKEEKEEERVAVATAAGGCRDGHERRRGGYGHVLSELRANYSRLFSNFLGFNLWVASWKQAIILLPYVLCGPQLFALEQPITMGVVRAAAAHATRPQSQPLCPTGAHTLAIVHDACKRCHSSCA